MPLYEFLRMNTKKLESEQHMSTDSSSIPENDFGELLWDRGQLTMQGQSSRTKINHNLNSVPFHRPKPRGKYLENANSSRKEILGSVESFLDQGVPSVDSSLNQHGDLVPWLSYPAEQSFPDDQTPANGTRPVESDGLVATNLQKENDLHNQSSYSSSKVDQRPSGSHPCEQSCLVKKSREVVKQNQGKSDISLHQVIGPDSNKVVSCGVKAFDAVGAVSYVCSGSSRDRTSNDKKLKRKCHDIEESEYRSEDVDEESGGVRKDTPTRGGVGSKRSRAAEVHNLSERRRRDRINEKMRTLQELIPNCNKADKASMLDEAIEYLKTLQLQVQVMSMGTGLWMSPMMFPAGMPHMHATRMPSFSPMGVGVGFGMNMINMNAGFPMLTVPMMQHMRFPSSSLSGHAQFSGVVGPNIPVLGHLGQGHPMAIPRAPMFLCSSHTSTSSSAGIEVTTDGVEMEVPRASPTTNIKNPSEDRNAQLMHDDDVNLTNEDVIPEGKAEVLTRLHHTIEDNVRSTNSDSGYLTI